MSREGEVRELFESARLESTPADRGRLLQAAEPIFEGLSARRRGSAREQPADRPSPLTRIRALLRARRRWAYAGALALIVGIGLLSGRREVRAPRSAPLESWAEHLKSDPEAPFPLASASFGRPY